jgi:dephospho-CoA kinase
MLIVGLTGGIGSGKSTVAEYFRRHGVPVIDADVIAHQLAEPDQPAYHEIVAAFGEGILDTHGRIDRGRLRNRVFDRPSERQQLESILHPRIREEMARRANSLDAPYCIFVIPLLIETGQRDLVDRILVVDADEEVRARWVRARSGLDAATIRKIMAAQADRESRLSSADDIIENNGTLAELETRVDQLHRHYLGIAESSG